MRRARNVGQAVLAVVGWSALVMGASWHSVAPPPNAYGWNNTPVTVRIESDNPPIYYRVSGGPVSSSPSPVDLVLSAEGVHAVEYRDQGEIGFKAVIVRIDLTPPVIVIRRPELGGRYWLNQPVIADWFAYDALSGIAGVEATTPSGMPVNTGSPGLAQFRVRAEDRAGNVSEAGAAYHVLFVLKTVQPSRFLLDRVLPPEETVLVGTRPLRARYTAGENVVVAFALKDFYGQPFARAWPELTVLRVELGEEERLPLRAWTRIPYNPDKGHYFLAYHTKEHLPGYYELWLYFGDGQMERIRIELRPSE